LTTSLRTRLTPPSLAELGIERVAWRDLGPSFVREWGYPHGRFEPEHLTVYGKSGSGKTYFAGYVLRQRVRARASHVVVVATKRADKTISAMGWPVIDTWPPSYGQNQVIYWAKAKGISAAHRVPQAAKVKALMDALWRADSNIIIYWDELSYIEVMLKLRPELETFYREGRSHGITNVAVMQRPSHVTRLAHSEAGWTVVFPPKDQDDRKRIAEVLGDRARFMAALADGQLDRTRHEFLIKHELTGEVYVSHLPAPRRPSAGRRTDTRAGGRRVRSA
jgi:hypothetical protein